MENSVIREMTADEVRERLEDEKSQLTKLKLNHAVSPIENPVRLKTSRKTIARLATELRKREQENKDNNGK